MFQELRTLLCSISATIVLCATVQGWAMESSDSDGQSDAYYSDSGQDEGEDEEQVVAPAPAPQGVFNESAFCQSLSVMRSIQEYNAFMGTFTYEQFKNMLDQQGVEQVGMNEELYVVHKQKISAHPAPRDFVKCALYTALRFNSPEQVKALLEDVIKSGTDPLVEDIIRNAYTIACRHHPLIFCEKIEALLLSFLTFHTVNQKNSSEGKTILHSVVEGTRFEFIKRLFEYPFDLQAKDFDLEAKDQDNLRPIHLAARLSTSDMLNYLLVLGDKQGLLRGRHINLSENSTPLHEAVLHKSFENIKFLCAQEDINLTIVNNSGNTPFRCLATAFKNVDDALLEEIVDTFIKAGENLNAELVTKNPQDNNIRVRSISLHPAIMSGNDALVKKLLTFPSLDINIPMVTESYDEKNRKWELIDSLSSLGLALACEQEALAVYMENKKDLEAVKKVKIARSIINNILAVGGINPNQVVQGAPLLHLAVRRGNGTGVKNILEQPGLNVNNLNKNGQTALHLLLSYEYNSYGFGDDAFDMIFALLLDHPHLDVNMVDKQGNAPLHLAVVKNKISSTLFSLLSHPKINVNAKNRQGKTVLSLLYKEYLIASKDAQNQKEELLQDFREQLIYLLRSGVLLDFNVTETGTILKLLFDGGWPKEFIGVFSPKHREQALQQLKKGSWKVDQQDEYGATLLMYMAAQGELEVVQTLLSHGASTLVKDADGNDIFSLINTIVKQLRFELSQHAQSIPAGLPERLYRYEQILAELYAAMVQSITHSAQPLILNQKTKASGKRKLQEAVEGTVSKKNKQEKEEETPVEAPQYVDGSNIINLLDTLPNELLVAIGAYLLSSVTTNK